MKKILITVAILFCFWVMQGQTQPSVAIKCSFGSDCFTPDPGTFITYSFDEFNVPSGYAVSTIFWLPVGQEDSGTNGNPSFQVSWLNSLSVNKKIKVTVTWKKTGSADITKSDEDPITVKYISTIPSMTVTGTGVSGTFSNNGIVTVPCGTRTLNISVPTPTTANPNSGVTYTWTLPSGWTGSSTTNSISANANAGAADGVIQLQYRRSDGTFLQSFILNVDRPQVGTPTITGLVNDPLCASETRSLTASATNATTFQWTGSSGITATPNNAATTSISTTANGTATVTVTANNACQVPQSRTENMQVGTTSIYNPIPSNPSINYINGTAFCSLQSNSPCASYKWRIFGGSGYLYPNSGGCGFTFGGVTYNEGNACTVSTSDFVRVEVNVANRCGVGIGHTFYLQNGSGYRMTSANPATSTVSMEFTSDFAVQNLKRVELIKDGSLQTARSFTPGIGTQSAAFQANRTLAFEVANLTRGKYYLHVVYEGGKKFSEILLLQ